LNSVLETSFIGLFYLVSCILLIIFNSDLAWSPSLLFLGYLATTSASNRLAYIYFVLSSSDR
jgi:hypothetical protein